MSARHWAAIAAGLTAWAALAILWATTPTHCGPPDTHQHVTCGQAGASR